MQCAVHRAPASTCPSLRPPGGGREGFVTQGGRCPTVFCVFVLKFYRVQAAEQEQTLSIYIPPAEHNALPQPKHFVKFIEGRWNKIEALINTFQHIFVMSNDPYYNNYSDV